MENQEISPLNNSWEQRRQAILMLSVNLLHCIKTKSQCSFHVFRVNRTSLKNWSKSFVEAWLSLSSFRAKSPFLHWLRKIAVRVGYRHWKNQGRSRREESLEAGHLLEELSHFEAQPATEVAEHLHALLQLIKPRNRLVLTMLYWEEHNVAQAAKLLGWSQSMVKVQAWRARRELKELIERAEHE